MFAMRSDQFKDHRAMVGYENEPNAVFQINEDGSQVDAPATFTPVVETNVDTAFE